MSDRFEAGEETALVVTQPGGVLVAGAPGKVDDVVARLQELTSDRTRTVRLTDLPALGTTAAVLWEGRSQYVRLTPRSMALLKQGSAVPTGQGSFWGFVRGPNQILGNLDFNPATLGPERLLALQTAGVCLALRAAIKDVQAAIERVESKVDDVLRLVRSERVGDVLGIREALTPLVERAHREGVIGVTDWSSIAGLGPEILQDLEGLRSHVRATLISAHGGWRPGDRADEAKGLFESNGLLTESLALLLVAEQNLVMWHELRLVSVNVTEPKEMAWTLGDAQAILQRQTEGDQLCADLFRDRAHRLTTPAGYDGLAIWQRDSLTDARRRLGELGAWFADQRVLDFEALDSAPYPTVQDSAQFLVRGAKVVATRSVAAVRLKLRRGPDRSPELLPPADPPLG